MCTHMSNIYRHVFACMCTGYLPKYLISVTSCGVICMAGENLLLYILAYFVNVMLYENKNNAEVPGREHLMSESRREEELRNFTLSQVWRLELSNPVLSRPCFH